MLSTVMVPVTALSDYLQRSLRRARKDVTELAKDSGVPESTLRPIMRGSTKQPDIVTLQQIAEPLGVSFESLCRAAVGLSPDAPEPLPFPNEARQQLLEIFDDLDPDAQRRAVDGLKALFG